MRGQGEIACKVIGIKDGIDGIAVTFGCGCKDGGNTHGFAAVVIDGVDCRLGGIACGDRNGENENVLAADHGCDVIAEHKLRAGGVLGGDDIDCLMRVDVDEVVFGKLSCEAGADHLGAVETENGIDDLGGVTVIGAERFGNGGCLGKTAFLCGDVDVIVTVRVVGRKMSLGNSQIEIGARGFDLGNACRWHKKSPP